MLNQIGETPYIKQEELDKIIELHKNYKTGKPGGKRCILQFKVLDKLNFRGCDLSDADFAGSSFMESDLSNCRFDNSNFYACNMSGADLTGASFKRADFRGAHISEANLTGADFTSVDMREGRLMQGARGQMVNKQHQGTEEDIVKTSFKGSTMKNSTFNGAKALSTDFTGADMSGASFVDADLRKANFKEANLSKADLTGSDLRSANMERSILSGTKLQWVSTDRTTNFTNARRDEDVHNDLYDGEKPLIDKIADHIAHVNSAGAIGTRLEVDGKDFSEIHTLRRYPLTALMAKNCNFEGMDLSQIQLQSSILHGGNFSGVNFSSADLRGSSFKDCNMQGVNLSMANLKPLFFSGKESDKKLFVNFENADLSGSNFYGADLSHANLRGADLTGADLSGTTLTKTDFRGAVMRDVKLEKANIEEAVR